MPFLPPNQQRQSTEGSSTVYLSSYLSVYYGEVNQSADVVGLLVAMDVDVDGQNAGDLGADERRHRDVERRPVVVVDFRGRSDGAGP